MDECANCNDCENELEECKITVNTFQTQYNTLITHYIAFRNLPHIKAAIEAHGDADAGGDIGGGMKRKKKRTKKKTKKKKYRR